MTNAKKKYILHVDGDAFFASCEISRRPDLQGKPVVVGEDRGIACAMTREAKALGISRGMPIFQIRRLFPQTIVLSSHFDLYQEYHDNLASMLRDRLPIVESYSIDECFAEMPHMDDNQIDIFVRKMKSDIQRALGITFSFGVAPTKTLAKLASNRGKPDGCTILIQRDALSNALDQTPIESVWGIGYQTHQKLARRNIKTAADFLQIPIADIHAHFTEPIEEIHKELSGIQTRFVASTHADHKSIQATRSLPKATENPSLLFSELSRNVEIACAELRSMELYTNAVHFFYAHKVGQSKYTFRRSAKVMLEYYTQDTQSILRAITPHVAALYKAGYRYKSTGITLSGLRRRESIPNDLFGRQTSTYTNAPHMRTIDRLNHRFGDFSVMYTSSMHSVQERKLESLQRSKNDTYESGLPLPYMGEVY